MSFIEMIHEERAEGRLAKVYEKIAGARGGVANVMKVQSLNPRAMEAHFELYKTLMFHRSELSRREREMIAVMVSATNGCDYCVAHHSTPLRALGVDEATIERLARSEIPVQIEERTACLLRFARALTRNPCCERKAIENLRAGGWSDSAVLDATMICAYFNFVNRIVLALGAYIEDDLESTCGP
jgi:uncharacterized peroxidase-related enzyme